MRKTSLVTLASLLLGMFLTEGHAIDLGVDARLAAHIHDNNPSMNPIRIGAGLPLRDIALGGSRDGSMVDPIADTNWKPIAIGAGGYLTGIDVSSDDAMVVRTDTYGAYSWTGAAWRQLVTTGSMPAADRTFGHNQGVYEIRISPSDSSVLYMAYLGNVYRSGDRGATWTKTAFVQVTENPNDSYRTRGPKMAIDPHDFGVVFAGTPQNGLLETSDGGNSWSPVAGVPPGISDEKNGYPGITGIVFDPSQGQIGQRTKVIYACSYGNGVYRSLDAGVTWQSLAGGVTDVKHAVVAGGAYYAIADSGKSLKSYSDGVWTQLLNNTYGTLQAVAVDPFNAKRIVIAAGNGTLVQSLDRGKTWSSNNNHYTLTASDIPWLATTDSYMSVGDIVFDPKIEGRLWMSAGVGVWFADVPADLSPNTALAWRSQSAGIEQLVANQVLAPPGGKPIVASWDRPFFYVGDPDRYPSTYVPSNKFAAGWSLDYASTQPGFLVGIADWFRIEESGYSTDGGQSWHVFPTFPAFGSKAVGGTIAASTPTNIVWAPAGGVPAYYTTDGGTSWKQITLPGLTDWKSLHSGFYLNRTTVTADRVLPNTFYLYDKGVYKTGDGGASWIEVHKGEISPYSGFNAHIKAVPGEAGNLFFSGGPQGGPRSPHPAKEGFYQSSDGGATWTAVPNVLEVICFGFGKAANPSGYPSIYIVGWVNRAYGIWQSDDRARSWTQIGQWPTGSLDLIKTISGDLNAYGDVYIGFGGSGYAYRQARH